MFQNFWSKILDISNRQSIPSDKSPFLSNKIKTIYEDPSGDLIRDIVRPQQPTMTVVSVDQKNYGTAAVKVSINKVNYNENGLPLDDQHQIVRYELFRTSTADATESKIAILTDTYEYIDTKLEPKTEYLYRVCCYDLIGNYNFSNKYAINVGDSIAPATPILVSSTADGQCTDSNNILVEWSVPVDTDYSYTIVEYKKTTESSYKNSGQITEGNRYRIANTDGVLYDIRITHYDKTNNASNKLTTQTLGQDLTPPVIASNWYTFTPVIAASDVACMRIAVKQSVSTDVVSYELFRKSTTGTASLGVVNKPATSADIIFEDRGISVNEAYEYAIRMTDKKKNSIQSSFVQTSFRRHVYTPTISFSNLNVKIYPDSNINVLFSLADADWVSPEPFTNVISQLYYRFEQQVGNTWTAYGSDTYLTVNSQQTYLYTASTTIAPNVSLTEMRVLVFAIDKNGRIGNGEYRFQSETKVYGTLAISAESVAMGVDISWSITGLTSQADADGITTVKLWAVIGGSINRTLADIRKLTYTPGSVSGIFQYQDTNDIKTPIVAYAQLVYRNGTTSSVVATAPVTPGNFSYTSLDPDTTIMKLQLFRSGVAYTPFAGERLYDDKLQANSGIAVSLPNSTVDNYITYNFIAPKIISRIVLDVELNRTITLAIESSDNGTVWTSYLWNSLSSFSVKQLTASLNMTYALNGSIYEFGGFVGLTMPPRHCKYLRVKMSWADTGNALNVYELNCVSEITADKIVAGSVDAYHIKANTITANQIQVGGITATTIANGAITTDKILAGSITTTHITASGLNASVVKAGILELRTENSDVNQSYIRVIQNKNDASSMCIYAERNGSFTAATGAAGAVHSLDLRIGTISTGGGGYADSGMGLPKAGYFEARYGVGAVFAGDYGGIRVLRNGSNDTGSVINKIACVIGKQYTTGLYKWQGGILIQDCDNYGISINGYGCSITGYYAYTHDGSLSGYSAGFSANIVDGVYTNRHKIINLYNSDGNNEFSVDGLGQLLVKHVVNSTTKNSEYFKYTSMFVAFGDLSRAMGTAYNTYKTSAYGPGYSGYGGIFLNMNTDCIVMLAGDWQGIYTNKSVLCYGLYCYQYAYFSTTVAIGQLQKAYGSGWIAWTASHIGQNLYAQTIIHNLNTTDIDVNIQFKDTGGVIHQRGNGMFYYIYQITPTTVTIVTDKNLSHFNTIATNWYSQIKVDVILKYV